MTEIEFLAATPDNSQKTVTPALGTAILLSSMTTCNSCMQIYTEMIK